MWDRFWHFLISAFIAYLMILFSIIVELYWRDRRTPGLIKAIWLILLIIPSYVTALVYLTFEGRAWPFERAKPRVPPRRRDRRIHPRGGRLLARAGNRRCCSTPAQSPNRNSTRSKPNRSARPDSSSARQSSGYGRTTIRSGHYGWRRSSSKSVLPDGHANSSTAPSNSVPPPLNRVLCRAISRNHALRSALSGEPRGRAAVSSPTTAGVRMLRLERAPLRPNRRSRGESSPTGPRDFMSYTSQNGDSDPIRHALWYNNFRNFIEKGRYA